MPECPIILVDDNETDRVLAETCYRKTGRSRPFLTLNSGKALLTYMEEVQHGKKPIPALVLLDINMPNLNGFETLKRLRANPKFALVPIITMFSHSDRPEDPDRVIATGAAGFETKPFIISEYVSLLKGLEEVILQSDLAPG